MTSFQLDDDMIYIFLWLLLWFWIQPSMGWWSWFPLYNLLREKWLNNSQCTSENFSTWITCISQSDVWLKCSFNFFECGWKNVVQKCVVQKCCRKTTHKATDSSIHTHIHTLMAEAAVEGASCSSEAIWGSVTYSKALQHVARRSRDSNQQPSYYETTHCTPWAYHLSVISPVFLSL